MLGEILNKLMVIGIAVDYGFKAKSKEYFINISVF